MRKKILAFVFAGALLAAAAIPGAALAGHDQGQGKSRDDAGKVEVCHIDRTISVSANAEAAHLAHGDTEGACT